MPHFVMIAHDGPDGPSLRDQHRQQHVSHVEALDRAGRIVLAGPIRDDTGERSIGAVIVLDAADLDDARRLVDSDPYVLGGVFESVLVQPFQHVFPKKK